MKKLITAVKGFFRPKNWLGWLTLSATIITFALMIRTIILTWNM